MDVLKEALMRHMAKNKKNGDAQDKDPQMSEQAPSLEQGDALAIHDQHQADGADDLKQKILEAIMGAGGHNGRSANGLHERAADKAKASMDMKKKC